MYSPVIGVIEKVGSFNLASVVGDGCLLIRSPNWLGDAIISMAAVYNFKETTR